MQSTRVLVISQAFSSTQELFTIPSYWSVPLLIAVFENIICDIFTGCASTKLQVDHGECKYNIIMSTPNILLRNYESQRLQMFCTN